MSKTPGLEGVFPLGDEPNTLGVFPVNQYLSDGELRKVVFDLMKSSKDGPPDTGSLSRFHPLTMAMFKRQDQVDADVYCLIYILGNLVRTRARIRNGVSSINPPPEDYICDCCHERNFLKQDYQTSSLDGANVSVWLCIGCSKLEPEARKITF